jgi:hypothetical protein
MTAKRGRQSRNASLLGRPRPFLILSTSIAQDAFFRES